MYINTFFNSLQVYSQDKTIIRNLYIFIIYLFIVKADCPVPSGEMFTLSVRHSFIRRRASFPVPIRYACQFISFFQYIIRVRQAKLRHYC